MKRGDLVVLKEPTGDFYHWNSIRDPVRRGFFLTDRDTRALLNGSLHSERAICTFGTKDVCLVLETLGDQILVMNSACQTGLIERGYVKMAEY